MLLSGCDALTSTVGGTVSAATPRVGLAPSAGRAPTSVDGVLRLAGAQPETLDPALSQDVSSWAYLLQIFSGLVSLDNGLEVVPEIASGWDVSADGRTYTFRLRPEARFQDGRTVTADDFKFSFERALDPALHSPVAGTYLGDIVGAADCLQGRAASVSGIRVVDAQTLEITIDAPKSYFLAKLTYPTAYVVDRANVAQGARWFERPNGTGPFKLQTFQPDSKIVLARNDAYYRGAPRLSRVEYDLGPNSAIALYEKDQLDVITVGPNNVERATDPRGALSRELVKEPQLSISYLGFDVTRPPFDDPKVRLAFAYATDKRRIADVLFKKMRVPAAGLLPPGLAGYDASFAGVPFDPAEARRLLAESRYSVPGSFPEVTLTMGSGGGSLGETFAEMYRRNLGVEISVEEVEESYYDGLAARQYQMFFMGWVADYPDPQDFLDVLFHSQSGVNHGGFADSEIDALLERARTEPDRAARLKLYQEAEARIVAAAPVVPLFFDSDYVLVKPWVKGLTWTPMGLVSLRDVSIAPN